MMKQWSWFILLCVALPGTVWANDTAFGGAASNPVPILAPDIRMVSENVRLVLDAEREAWTTTCEFTFENMSDEPVEVIIGFPFETVEGGPGGGQRTAPRGVKVTRLEEGMRVPWVWNFKASIDREEVATELKDLGESDLFDEYYGYAYVWTTRFEPRATRKIVNTFETALTESAAYTYYAEYTLETGKVWHDGTIGHARIEVRVPRGWIPCRDNEPVPFEDTPHEWAGGDPEPAGARVVADADGTSVSWELTNFRPTKDVSVCLRKRHELAEEYVRWVDISAMSPDQLRRSRNRVYAYYGYRFKSADLRAHFGSEWWYLEDPGFKGLEEMSALAQEHIRRVRELERQVSAGDDVHSTTDAGPKPMSVPPPPGSPRGCGSNCSIAVMIVIGAAPRRRRRELNRA